MTLLRRSFTPPVGGCSVEGNCRFEAFLPGRDDDWLNFKYSTLKCPEIKLPHKPRPIVKELRRPLPASVAHGGVSPRVQPFDVPMARSTLRPKSAAAAIGRELPSFIVPLAPPKVQGGVVKPARIHERIRAGSARGIATRAAVRRAIAGPNASTSRWSDLKVLYTQLVDAINGDCIPTLLSSIAQVEAAGMFDWPEYGSALARLGSLQHLMARLESATVSSDISELERALDDARLLRAGPAGLASGVKWSLEDAAEYRLNSLRGVHRELKNAANGSSIPLLEWALRCADDMKVKSWPEVQFAQSRWKVLVAAHSRLCDALGGDSLAGLRVAETSALNLGITEESDLPLGETFAAVRQRLAKSEHVEVGEQGNGLEVGVIRLVLASDHLERSEVGTEVDSISLSSSKCVAPVCKDVDANINHILNSELHTVFRRKSTIEDATDEEPSRCSSKGTNLFLNEVDANIESIVDCQLLQIRALEDAKHKRFSACSSNHVTLGCNEVDTNIDGMVDTRLDLLPRRSPTMGDEVDEVATLGSAEYVTFVCSEIDSNINSMVYTRLDILHRKTCSMEDVVDESASLRSAEYVTPVCNEIDSNINSMVDNQLNPIPRRESAMDDVVDESASGSSKYVASVCNEMDAALENMVDAQLDLSRRMSVVADTCSSRGSEMIPNEVTAALTVVMLEDLASGNFSDMDLSHFPTDRSGVPGGNCISPDLLESTRHPSTTPGLSDGVNQSGWNSTCRPDSGNSRNGDNSTALVNDGRSQADNDKVQNEDMDSAFLMVCEAVLAVADTQTSYTQTSESIHSHISPIGI